MKIIPAKYYTGKLNLLRHTDKKQWNKLVLKDFLTNNKTLT